MTEAELHEAVLAQAAYGAMSGHPLILAFTNLISAHQDVTLNAAPLHVLKTAQANLAMALSGWIGTGGEQVTGNIQNGTK
jgi:uncharacterized protein (DUF1810 family)